MTGRDLRAAGAGWHPRASVTPEPALRRPLAIAAFALALLGCGEAVDEGVLAGGPPPAPEPPADQALALAPEERPPDRATLRFGVTPAAAGVTYTHELFDPVVRYLGRTLQTPVELVVAPDYQALIDGVVGGDVDFAHMPPLAYVLARRQRPELQLLASQIAYGATSYSAYIVVRADDPAASLADLQGRRVAFVDPRSTSGYLFAYAALIEHGLAPERTFSEVRFAGSHMAAITALREGHVDAAATASGMLGIAARDLPRPAPGASDATELRILFKAGRIPYDALVASPTVPASGAEKIRWAFVRLSTRTAEGRTVLGPSDGTSGWAPAEDRSYDDVRQVLARVEAQRGHRLDAPRPDRAAPAAPTEEATGVLGP